MQRLLAPVLLSATAAVCLAAPPLEEWRIERREWTRQAAEVGAVELVNEWGDVRVRGGRPGEIYLLTVSQRHRADPREPGVLFREVPGGLAIETRFREEEGESSAAGEDWDRRRIDLTAYLPKPLPVKIRTVEGLAEVRGLSGDLELETRRGDIAVRSAGRVVARSEHGAIQVHFADTAWSAPAALETVTGAISVDLPDGAGARVELETRGDVTTDYSLQIERVEGSRLKRGTARVDGEGPALRLHSYSGAIAIRRWFGSATP